MNDEGEAGGEAAAAGAAGRPGERDDPARTRRAPERERLHRGELELCQPEPGQPLDPPATVASAARGIAHALRERRIGKLRSARALPGGAGTIRALTVGAPGQGSRRGSEASRDGEGRVELASGQPIVRPAHSGPELSGPRAAPLDERSFWRRR